MPTAVAEVNEHAWYTAHKASEYNSASLVNYFAPLPVFFEGYQSTPRYTPAQAIATYITEYRWDFGDGSPYEYGPNAYHTYETPGSYTCTLRVTDNLAATDTDTVGITVNARSGTTYYADSALGDDTNAGTASGASAWKTVTRALQQLRKDHASGGYAEGDTVLFERDQTFELDQDGGNLVATGHSGLATGVSFQATGTGDDPIWNITGSGYALKIQGRGWGHISFVDIHVQNASPEFMFATQDLHQLLFLRMTMTNCSRGMSFSGYNYDGDLDNNQGGIFYDQCDLVSITNGTAIYLQGSFRFVFRDSRIRDYLDPGHGIYGAYVRLGLIIDSKIEGGNFGHTALRLTAAPAGTQGSYQECGECYLARNVFAGKLHANGRYTFRLVDLTPNKGANEFDSVNNWVEDCEFEQFENGLAIAANESWLGRRLLFYTDDDSNQTGDVGSVEVGDTFERRSNQYLEIYNSYFSRTFGGSASPRTQITIGGYDGTDVSGRNKHEDISIHDNWLHHRDAGGRMYNFVDRIGGSPVQTDVDELTSDNHIIYRDDETDLNKVEFSGGTTEYDLSEWRTTNSEDAATVVRDESKMPVAPSVTSPATASATPVAVTYSGATVASGETLSHVVLWVKRAFGAWVETTITNAAASGTLNYSGFRDANTYYFFVQTVDNNGNKSWPLRGVLPSARTIWDGGDVEPPPQFNPAWAGNGNTLIGA